MKLLMLFFTLLFFTASAAAFGFQLTVNNSTDTGFTAVTVGGQWLGYIEKGQHGALVNVPFIPEFPAYAVSLQGDNGKNGAVINRGSYPFCPSQVTYHHCKFSHVTAYHATVTINP